MKVYVIYEPYHENANEGSNVLGVYTDLEKAKKLIEDSDLFIEELELDKEVSAVYRVDIGLAGKGFSIESCYKVFNETEKVVLIYGLTVYTKANGEEEAKQKAIQIAKENTTVITIEKTVNTIEKLVWKE